MEVMVGYEDVSGEMLCSELLVHRLFLFGFELWGSACGGVQLGSLSLLFYFCDLQQFLLCDGRQDRGGAVSRNHEIFHNLSRENIYMFEVGS